MQALLSYLVLFASITTFLGSSVDTGAAQGRPATAASAPESDLDWPEYGGPLGQHYSRLQQINTQNAGQLKVAWQFDTEEAEGGGLESTSIVIGRAVYVCTPMEHVLKLDAATGKLLWKFDSGIRSSQPCRGVTYWSDGKQERIFAGVMNFLYALDAQTGKPIGSFGGEGRVDLRRNLRGSFRGQSVALTTPGVVYKDLIIVGGRNPETYPAPPGDIRAFDVRTGALRWTFHTIPHPGEAGEETWPPDAWTYAGSANNWAGMTVDPQSGLVFVPTGSAVFDFYGGDRAGDDLYSDTLLALDAETGKLVWHYQTTHHDIWDRDLATPPTLVKVEREGRMVDAIAQPSKQGFLFVLDRATGKPLFPIEERKVRSSTVPGEKTSPTQPFPVLPEPFARQAVTAADLTMRTPEAHAWALQQYKQLGNEGQFEPLEVNKLKLIAPGFDGGAMWGGSAYDPVSHVFFVNGNNTAWIAGLLAPSAAKTPGEQIYRTQCSLCHGLDRGGQPPAFPSLVEINKRRSDTYIVAQIRNGKGRMPAYPDLSTDNLAKLVTFLHTGLEQVGTTTAKETPPASARELTSTVASGDRDLANRVPYTFTGYKKFLDPEGYPAVSPPWGTLNAIDLNTGKYLWRIPFGTYPELAAKGIPDTGTENFGGPVVTAGGVLFIGATVHDELFHVYDTQSGKLLWQTKLPYAGLATPSTYMVDGRQYILIAAGGGKDTPKHRGGIFVAFALP